MEQELIRNLVVCARAYMKARGIGLATVGRMAAGDWRFFSQLEDGSKSFTARKYDEVISWFSLNWPADTAWPADVTRPEVAPS